MFDWLKRLGLRWVVLYLALYIVVGTEESAILVYDTTLHANTTLFGLGWLFKVNFGLWRVVVPWVGKYVLHLTHPILPVFGYDTLFEYVETGIILVLALVGAILWTCFDRDRQRERVLYEATRILVRYTLASMMFVYGFTKVFHLQFPYPNLSLLMTPVGALQPVELMFALMGYSTIYSLFAGLAEVIGGALLLFRRTTTLGALVIAGVMTNVVMMNFAFDLAVRLFAGLIIFMAIFLMAPDLLRLANAIVLYREVPAGNVTRVWPKGWMGPASLVLKVLVMGWVLYNVLAFDFKLGADVATANKMELVGLYRVERFSSIGKSDPLLVRDGKLWQRVAIDIDRGGSSEMAVRTADDVIQDSSLQVDHIDAMHGRFILTRSGDTHSTPIVFRYVVLHRRAPSGSPTRPSNEVLVLNGKVDDAAISMRLDRLDTGHSVLMSHRFRLIAPDTE